MPLEGPVAQDRGEIAAEPARPSAIADAAGALRCPRGRPRRPADSRGSGAVDPGARPPLRPIGPDPAGAIGPQAPGERIGPVVREAMPGPRGPVDLEYPDPAAGRGGAAGPAARDARGRPSASGPTRRRPRRRSRGPRPGPGVRGRWAMARVQPSGLPGLPAVRGPTGGRPLADVPEVYRSRLDPNRSALAQRPARARASEQAVERALDWLARHQDADGRWDGGTAKDDDGTVAAGRRQLHRPLPARRVCSGECYLLGGRHRR